MEKSECKCMYSDNRAFVVYQSYYAESHVLV